jgi:bla regulator protein blaR1
MLAGSRDVTMEVLARSLSVVDLGRPVIDKTGLKGNFDFTLEWTPEPAGSAASDSPAPPAPVVGPTPIEALRDQLGLKLEPPRASLPILVVDRVARPSEN